MAPISQPRSGHSRAPPRGAGALRRVARATTTGRRERFVRIAAAATLGLPRPRRLASDATRGDACCICSRVRYDLAPRRQRPDHAVTSSSSPSAGATPTKPRGALRRSVLGCSAGEPRPRPSCSGVGRCLYHGVRRCARCRSAVDARASRRELFFAPSSSTPRIAILLSTTKRGSDGTLGAPAPGSLPRRVCDAVLRGGRRGATAARRRFRNGSPAGPPHAPAWVSEGGKPSTATSVRAGREFCDRARRPGLVFSVCSWRRSSATPDGSYGVRERSGRSATLRASLQLFPPAALLGAVNALCALATAARSSARSERVSRLR